MVTTIIGILLLVMALFLIVSILMQSGKSKRLSGTIAGGAEMFFGKEKGQAINRRLSMVTNIVAIVFVALVLALFLLNARQNAKDAEGSSAADTSAVSSEDASADSSAASEDASAESGAASEDASAESGAASEDASAESGAASEDASAESGAASEE